MQFLDQEGQNVEEALASALALLKKTPREVEYEILEEGAPGTAPVLIRVYPNSELLLDVRDTLEDLLDALQMDGSVEATFTNETQITAQIATNDANIMIGHHGATLDSMQHILNAMLKFENYHVIVDVANYRERHRERLEDLARKLARQVLATRRPFEMKPMSPADRRIIHLTVQTFNDLTTESIGEESDRRVIISLKNYQRPHYRRPGNNFRTQHSESGEQQRQPRPYPPRPSN